MTDNRSVSGDDPEPSALDHVFHDSNFVEYAPEPLIPPRPSRERAEPKAGAGAGAHSGDPAATQLMATVFKPGSLEPTRLAAQPFAPIPSRPSALTPGHRTMFWIAGAVLAAIVLVILFLVGTRLAPHAASPSANSTAAHSTAASATPRAAASAAVPSTTPAPPTAPAAFGSHKWTELRGGECLSPYDSPWAESFTVVDCATPHAAQLVYRADFATPGGAATAPKVWPGDAALASQINLLCTAPAVIDLAAAGTYSDIQFQGSFAASAAEWAAGNHAYSCFVSRSSGQPLTTSVAGTH